MIRLKFTKRESVSGLLTSIANDHSFKKLYTKCDGVSELVSESASPLVTSIAMIGLGSDKNRKALYKTEHYKSPDT